MATGTSLLLIAMGAILAFAVNYQTTGIDINAIGWIFMLIGFVGLIMSLLFWSELTASWRQPRSTYYPESGPPPSAHTHETIVERDRPPVHTHGEPPPLPH